MSLAGSPLASLMSGATIEPVPGGGFAVTAAVDGGQRFSRFDDELRPVTSFGLNGTLQVSGFAKFRADGGLLSISNDRRTWRQYASDGELVRTTPVTGLSGLRDPGGRLYTFNGGFGVAADGSVRVQLQQSATAPFYHGVAKLRPDLTFDPTYAGDGVADQTAASPFYYFEVAPDGRAAAIDGAGFFDGTLELQVFDPSGFPQFAGGDVRIFTPDPPLSSDDTFGFAKDVFFHPDGDVSVAYRIIANFSGNNVNDIVFPGFAVARINADGSPDAETGDTRVRTGIDTFMPGDNLATPTADGDYLFFGNIYGDDPQSQIYRIDTGPGDSSGGGATTGFGTNGRALLSFPGDNFAEIRQSVPAPDGGLYAIGVHGDITVLTPPPPFGLTNGSYAPRNLVGFVAKFKADGTLDASFSGDGLATPAELGFPTGGDLTDLQPAVGGGYLGTVGNYFIKLTANFRRDVSFGGFGDGIASISGPGSFDQRGDGKILFASRSDFGTAGYLEIYNADGSLQNGSRKSLLPLLGDKLSTKDLTLGADGSVYLTSGGRYDFGPGGATPVTPPGESYQLLYTQITKLTPSLDLDGGYADGGRLREYFATNDFFGSGSEIFVGDNGRTFTQISEDDGQSTYVLADAGGNVLYAASQASLFSTSAVPTASGEANEAIFDVGFAADGSVAVAGTYSTFETQAFGTDRVSRAFAVTRFKPDGGRDAGFGNNGTLTLFNADAPITINDADFNANNVLVAAGSDGAVTFGPGRTIAGVNVSASARKLDVLGDNNGGGTGTPATVTFESAPLGATPQAGYTDPSGFRFVSVDGRTGTGTEVLKVYGPANNFPSKVLQPNNFGRSVVITRPDGKRFDLTSFKLGASVYGSGGDAVVTATFADGRTSSLTASFTGDKRNATVVRPNFAGATKVTINFVGGVNDYYGTLDDFQFAVLNGGGGTPAVGDGLLGTYYDNRDLTGEVFSRVDPTVDFNFGDGSPDPRVGRETFSIRWTGRLVAPAAGNYQFRLYADDGARLSLFGSRVIDDFTDHAARYATSGNVALAAGQSVPLVLDYYENTGGAQIRFEWKRPGDAGFSVVPQGALFSA